MGFDGGRAMTAGEIAARGEKQAKSVDGGKRFYKMREVCRMTGLEAHVLRFWESEFPALRPKKNRAGHRNFSSNDIALIERIRELVHDRGFTIAGARKALDEPGADTGNEGGKDLAKQALLAEIRAIRETLEAAVKVLDGS